jgi:hypothetical protein
VFSRRRHAGPKPGGRLKARPYLVFVLVAAIGLAQNTPASVQISAERSWVLAGRTLSLQATALGEFGETIPGADLQWASSNPSVARVSAGGAVSGLLPGRAIIEASADGVSGQFTVWVHPARIEITPGRADLEIGGSASLSARALDADGRPLAGPGFTWYSSLPAVARVDANGNLQAVASGSVTITARLNVPEGGVSFAGQSQAFVRPRQPFRAERLISSDYTTPASVKAIQQLDYSNDRFVFHASLSSGGQALMLYENGAVRKLIATGDLAANGAAVRGIENAAINARGDVVAVIGLTNLPDVAVFFPYAKPSEQAFVQEPDGRCCLSLTAGALADDGEFVFTAWNGAPGVNAGELYLSRPGSTAVRLPTENLPGFGRAYWMPERFRMAGPGQVLFTAGAPNGSGVFFWDGRQMFKLVANNETVLGMTVNGFDNRVVSGAAGDAYVLMRGNGCMAARWFTGAWTKVIECGQQFGDLQIHGIHWLVAARDGALLFDGNVNGNGGLYRFASGQLQQLLSWGDSGSNRFQWLRRGFLRPDGDAVVWGPFGSSHSRIARLRAGSETLLYETGRSVDFSSALAVDWNWQRGAGAGGALVTRTVSSAVVRLGLNTAEILLSPGDVLADGAFVDGIGTMAAAPNGDLAVQLGTSRGPRLFLYRQQTRIEVHGPSNRIQLGGDDLDWFQNQLAVNSRGQIVAQVRTRNPENGSQSERVILFSDTDRQARTIYFLGAPAPGGGTLNWLNEVAIDDQGRVWFATEATPGVRSLFLWENGTIRRLYTASDPLPDGRRIQNFGLLQTANGRLYFSSRFPNSPNALLEADGTRVRYVLTHGMPTSFGSQINGFHNGGQFRVAPNGDIAYMAHLQNESTSLLIRKAGGTDVIVARQNDRLDSALWIENLLDTTWNNDGRLFFTASTVGEGTRIGLFLATPQ